MTPSNFRSIRKDQLKLTQRQLGRALGITPEYVGEIEAGRATPKRGLIRLIEMYRDHGVPAHHLADDPLL